MLEQAKKLLSDHDDVISTLSIGQRGSGTGPNATIITEGSESVKSYQYSRQDFPPYRELSGREH